MKYFFVMVSVFLCYTQLCAHPATSVRTQTINDQIATDELNPDLLFERGQLLLQQHQYQMAEKDFHQAFESGATIAEYSYHMALLYRHQNQSAKAKTTLLEGLVWGLHNQENKKLLALINLNLAEIYAAEQNWEKAASHYHAMIKVTTVTDPTPYLLASHYYQLAGNQHLPQALRILNTGIQKNPGNLCYQQQAVALEFRLLKIQSVYQRISQLINKHPKIKNNPSLISQLNCDVVENGLLQLSQPGLTDVYQP